MPQNCNTGGKSCKMYAIFTMFSSSDVPFLHVQSNNAVQQFQIFLKKIIHHKHHDVLFIFIIIYLKQKHLNSIKRNMLHYEKLETLQPVISSVVCLYENIILYKYNVTLIVFFNSCLPSNKILKDVKKF